MKRKSLNKKSGNSIGNLFMKGITIKFSLLVLIAFCFIANAQISRAKSEFEGMEAAIIKMQERVATNGDRIKELELEIYQAKDKNNVISRATSSLGMYSPSNESVIFVNPLPVYNVKLALVP